MNKIAIFTFCMALIMVTGCAPRPQEPGPVRMTIAFQEWVGYGLFYLAQEKGFLKEEGVELVFVDEQLDSARRDAFKQGMLDIEAGTIDQLVSKAAQDTPIVTVMELDMSFGADAIVAAENIKTLEDLEGKRVILARDDVGETFLSALFYKKGLPFNSLTIVAKSPEEVADVFVHGEAEACATWEPLVSEAMKRPGAHILTSSREHPGIIIDTLNVRRDLVEKEPRAVKSLMRAWFKALKYYKENPLEASGIIAQHYSLTPELYRKQVEGLQWPDYEQQRSKSQDLKWIDTFNMIVSVKLSNGRISKQPNAVKAINRVLLEGLYENRP